LGVSSDGNYLFSDNVTDNVAEGLVLFVFGRQMNYEVFTLENTKFQLY